MMTVREFLNLPELEEGEKMELIGGEIVRSEPGKCLHEITKSNVLHLLVGWLSRNPRGKVFGSSMFQLDEVNSLMPDVSVLFPDPKSSGTGLLRGAPELAIEVISSEKASDLEDRIELYLAHGSQSVWVVFPGLRVVRVFEANGQSRKFEQAQILEDPVLPGFSAPVSSVFEGI
jgi:Uma2 family endonuclease